MGSNTETENAFPVDWMTGLPAVPEGYFWNVSKRSEQIHMDTVTYASNGGFTGWVWKDVAVVTLMRTDRIFIRKWWNDHYKDVNVAIHALTVCEKLKSVSEIGTTVTSYDYSITPESILRTANKIMALKDMATKERARKAAEDALMGNYPPKRLGEKYGRH